MFHRIMNALYPSRQIEFSWYRIDAIQRGRQSENVISYGKIFLVNVYTQIDLVNPVFVLRVL